MIHGRFSGEHRPVNWIGVDILRIADGVLAEHWDVLQDEATRAESKSGLSKMTGLRVPAPPDAIGARLDDNHAARA